MLPPPRASMENNQHVANIQHFEVSINYNINGPTEPNSWNGKAHPISIFRHMKFLEIDSKNMFTSLLQMADFIRARKGKKAKYQMLLTYKGLVK